MVMIRNLSRKLFVVVADVVHYRCTNHLLTTRQILNIISTHTLMDCTSMSQQWTETLHRLFSNDDLEVLAELRRFRLRDDVNHDIIDCAVCAIYFFICLLK